MHGLLYGWILCLLSIFLFVNTVSPASANLSQSRLDEALVKAVAFGNESKVRTLLARGVSPNARDRKWNGRTALMDAAFEQDEGAAYCYPDIAKLLVSSGADVNLKDDLGDTALMYVAQVGVDNEGDAVELAKYLITHHARVSVRNNQGESALGIAEENGMNNLVRLLKNTTHKRKT